MEKSKSCAQYRCSKLRKNLDLQSVECLQNVGIEIGADPVPQAHQSAARSAQMSALLAGRGAVNGTVWPVPRCAQLPSRSQPIDSPCLSDYIRRHVVRIELNNVVYAARTVFMASFTLSQRTKIGPESL